MLLTSKAHPAMLTGNSMPPAFLQIHDLPAHATSFSSLQTNTLQISIMNVRENGLSAPAKFDIGFQNLLPTMIQKQQVCGHETYL